MTLQNSARRGHGRPGSSASQTGLATVPYWLTIGSSLVAIADRMAPHRSTGCKLPAASQLSLPASPTGIEPMLQFGMTPEAPASATLGAPWPSRPSWPSFPVHLSWACDLQLLSKGTTRDHLRVRHVPAWTRSHGVAPVGACQPRRPRPMVSAGFLAITTCPSTPRHSVAGRGHRYQAGPVRAVRGRGSGTRRVGVPRRFGLTSSSVAWP